jgi:nucleotide-binding universal stress UspA family protein
MKTKTRAILPLNKSVRRASGIKSSRARSKSATFSTRMNIKSILIPTDFSVESEKALAYAIPLARLCAARISLLHVIEPIATPDFLNAFPIAMENDVVMKKSKQHLQQVAAALNVEPLVEKYLVRNGRSFHEIVSAARSLKSDLIVISTHGRTGLSRALLGSTTERVVQHAPCPVLVVRPNEREFLKSANIEKKK